MDRQTDRQMDGRAIAYTRYSVYAVMHKKVTFKYLLNILCSLARSDHVSCQLLHVVKKLEHVFT